MGRPPKQPAGRMSDAERARAYRENKRTADRDAREAKQAADADRASAQLAKAGRRFAFILADPPTDWQGGRGRLARYDRMTVEALCFLGDEIRIRADDDAVLWLWSTRPLLLKAPHRIIPAWGFTDSTSWAWIKEGDDGELERGTGLVLVDQHEILIHCTRGKGVQPAAWGEQPGSVIKAPRPRQPGMKRPWSSRKPMIVHQMAERYYPTCTKLEMFARPPFRRGWHVMGDGVPGGYMTPEEAERAALVGEW
jgi:N6-adenosine-specific RNA methylase IME4